jgi:hypothetical protein
MPLAPPIPRKLCGRGGEARGSHLPLVSSAQGWEARETHVRLPIGPLRAEKWVKQNRTSVFGVSGLPQRLRTIGHFL